MKINIIGAGLIGTSIALGLRSKGHEITIEDSNRSHMEIAQDLLGGLNRLESAAELVIVATPIEWQMSLLQEAFNANPQAAFIDIGGLKFDLLHKVEELPALAARFCGTHPMAGREISGPTGARGDLFQGATWIVTPSKVTDPDVMEKVHRIIEDLGSVAKEVSAGDHDRVIASLSHIPQILSSAIASNLESTSDDELLLAGQGLRDLTRLADSSSALWTQLVSANSERVLESLEKITVTIEELMLNLRNKNVAGISDFFIKGNVQKSRIPGKHGGKSRTYAFLPIVIDDKPGQLASIFDACSKAQVNIEDLFIEHSPGQETGLVTLAVAPEDAPILKNFLEQESWRVHDIRAQR